MNHTNQFNPSLTAAAARTGDEPIPELPENKPRAVFVTNYELTREREDMLDDDCTKWLEKLEAAHGWEHISDATSFNYGQHLAAASASDPFLMGNLPRKHFHRRALFELMARNVFEWRQWLYPGTIFSQSNISIPLCRRISFSLYGKALKSLLGTKPIWRVTPKGVPSATREDFAAALTTLCASKAEASDWETTAILGIQQAFDLGEAVIHTGWKTNISLYRKKDIVLCEADGKTPIIAQDGEYITKEDKWSMAQVMPAEDPEALPPSPGAPPAPEPAMITARVLNRDGVTIIPDDAVYKKGSWAHTHVSYKGPKSTLVDYRHFLAPLDVASLQDAECCVYFYDTTPSELMARFMRTDNGQNVMSGMELLKVLQEVDPAAAAGVEENASGQTGGNDASPLRVYEFYKRTDADGDGMTEDILYVRVKIKEKTYPLFYDYIENVTETKRRPFSVWRPLPVRGSWTGVGAIELFEKHQLIVDLMANRWNFAVSGSGTVTIYDPEAFEETSGKSGAKADLQLNNGATLKLKPGKSLENSLRREYLENPIGDQWKEIMDYFMQLAMNESGATHANDGEALGMQSQKTATGIRNIENSAAVTFEVFMRSLTSGIMDTCQQFTKTAFAGIETDEVVELTGREPAQQFTISPRDVKSLEFTTEVVLGTAKSDQMLQATMQAWPILVEFLNQPLPIQLRGQPLLRQMFTALQLDTSGEMLQPIVSNIDPALMPVLMEFLQSAPDEIRDYLISSVSAAQQPAEPQPK